ncbi:hypothetical protein ADT27_13460 [Xanthomonas oryzae]|nr:hypothetical protein ADT27_13460 [Xanthomonas oryzae]
MPMVLYRLHQLWDKIAAMYLANTAGWVVIGSPLNWDDKPFHAVGNGREFGMDYYTGRFPDRKSAQRFAAYRNSAAQQLVVPAYRYVVAHETRTLVKLLGD